MERALPIVLVASLGWIAPATQAPARPVDFPHDVKPILDAHCISCHGPTKQKGEYRVDTYAAAIEGSPGGKSIVPGSPGGSDFFRRLVSDDSDYRMPQKEGRLAPSQIELIRRWIEEGAKPAATKPDSSHWAFVPPSEPETPSVKDRAWIRNPIDRFVLAKLEAEGKSPSPEAAKEDLLRHLRLDLTGSPPSANEVAAFEKDSSPDAYEREVDRLLASSAYSERMAAWWIDVVHASASPAQHDRLVEAFAKDLPFDTLAVEQMSGDLRAGEALLGVPLATAIAKLGAPPPEDRARCARWIASTENPLFARVAANRIWALLLGNGIVATPDDFGEHGEPPSNPALLDWLALDFVGSGWSVRHLVNRIVSSATYRQARMHSER
jgi:mono/diheme cytochrome c family protein